MDNGTDVVVRSPRIFERRRAVRLERVRKRRRWLVAAVLALAAGAGAWAMTGTSVFAIADVVVVGTQYTEAEDIIAASGLTIGASALGADLDAAAARVEALPDIREARVERDGVLVRLVISERVPAVSVTAGNKTWVLDREGVLLSLAKMRKGPQVLLSMVDGELDGAPLDGEQVARITRLWKGLTPRERADLGVITMAGDGSIEFAVGPTIVRFGDLDQVPRKIQAFHLVLKDVRFAGERLLEIDLRSPSRPAAVIA